MFERFTDESRRVVVLAQEEARLMRNNYIGDEHLLVGLAHEEDGFAHRVLEDMGLPLERVRLQVYGRVGEGTDPPVGHIPFTPRAKKVIEMALREALQLGHNWIGTEHMLLGIIREGEGVAAQILENAQSSLVIARRYVMERLVREEPDPWKIRCARCGNELDRPGALLFSPPNPASNVRKDHICRLCYTEIKATFKR